MCFEIYSRFETQMFVSSGELRDLILESLRVCVRERLALVPGCEGEPQVSQVSAFFSVYRAVTT